MSTELTVIDRVIKTVGESRDQLAAAWPGGPGKFSADRFNRITTTILRQNPALAACNPGLLLGCLVRLAQIGLYPDSQLGHAYIVPYGNTPTLIVGYRGMLELARRSGEVRALTAEVVCKQDNYAVRLGSDPHIHHVPAPGPRDEATIVAAYAVAVLRHGDRQFAWLDKSDIERIRSVSRAGRKGPWVDHFAEMAKKTAVRRLCKLLPLSLEAQEAIAAVDAEEVDLDVVGQQRHNQQPRSARPDPLAAIAAEADEVDPERAAIQHEANGA